MKNSVIGLILTLALVKAEKTCNNDGLGFPCCKKGTSVSLQDQDADWGVNNDNWCIVQRCWASLIQSNYRYCSDKATFYSTDQDGKWGLENGEFCGYRGSVQRWNDRELNDKTRKEWNAFKQKWDDKYSSNFERLSILPGEDESMLNFGWYSTTKSTPYICWGTKKDGSDCKEIKGTVKYYKDLYGTSYYSNKVTVTGIKRNQKYYYKRKLNGKYEGLIQFNTYDSDNFNFIFLGDPQLGGSHDRITASNNYIRALSREEGNRNDAFNWNRTISSSFKFAKKPSLILSAGDQADEEYSSTDPYYDYNEESQYSALLLPNLMQTIPLVPTIGNHDNYTQNFNNHFNTPNTYSSQSYLDYYNSKPPGYNYYFKYNNVLNVVLNSNVPTCKDFSKIIKNAVNKYPNTTWRIAMFHHDLYGDGVIHSQSSIISDLRNCLTQLITDYKFDLVINGHDHVYSVSKLIYYNNGSYGYNEIKTNKAYRNPKGTLYITANCSTGNKLYEYLSPKLDYIFKHDQTYSSTFGILDFKKDSEKFTMTINTYDVESHNLVDGPYIFEKDLKSSNNNSNNINNNSNNSKCWSLSLGYNCCSSKTDVISKDENGSWGLEYDKNGNLDWCGIISNSNCWAERLGYKCCSSKTDVISKDENGSWGLEYDKNGNLDWCGINSNSNCWAEALGYKCCTGNNPSVVFSDGSGDWSVENDKWCGIVGKSNAKTTIKKTSSKKTTTTTKKTSSKKTTTTAKKTTTKKTTTKKTTTKKTTTTVKKTTTKKAFFSSDCVEDLAQCGGANFSGPNCCKSQGYVCNFYSEYYAQCIPKEWVN